MEDYYIKYTPTKTMTELYKLNKKNIKKYKINNKNKQFLLEKEKKE
jgi:hypothetical protein